LGGGWKQIAVTGKQNWHRQEQKQKAAKQNARRREQMTPFWGAAYVKS